MNDSALFFIAVIIFISKLLSRLFQKINLPPVLGMIIIGLIVGPTGFNLIKEESDIEKIKFFAQIGVIILLFLAGMETDLKEIKKVGKNSLFIALGGVIVPFAFGFLLTQAIVNFDIISFSFKYGTPLNFKLLLTKNIGISLIMGLILTATSVSVSVMTLMDMGKLKSVEGSTIVNAAIIDDIIGIILLSIILTFVDTTKGFEETIFTLIKVILYFAGVILAGIFLIPLLSKLLSKMKIEMIILSFVFFCMFIFAWIAERVEIAAITGAYFAGVFIGRLKDKHKIEEGVRNIGHTLFISIFFVYIGIQTNLRTFINIKTTSIIFIILFVFFAFLSKIIGSGGAAKIIGFDLKRSFRIGSGMIPRGEVALIIASLAMKKSIISNEYFTAVIAMVIFTSSITPFLLKFGFFEKKNKGEINAS